MKIKTKENKWRERRIPPKRLNINGGIFPKGVFQHTHRAVESGNG